MSAVDFTYHLCNQSEPVIECRTGQYAQAPAPYPVLTVGVVTFFPTDEQLRQIRNAIDGYLSAQVVPPEIEPVLDTSEMDAEAQRVADPTYTPTLDQQRISRILGSEMRPLTAEEKAALPF